jgi:hypothetical protein
LDITFQLIHELADISRIKPHESLFAITARHDAMLLQSAKH